MIEKKGEKNNIASDLEAVLIRPRVTEKATLNATQNVYVFDVAVRANKFQIEEAVFDLYKVRPEKIRIARVPAKKIVYRGRKGVKAGGKKAYIYLKKGDKISVV